MNETDPLESNYTLKNGGMSLTNGTAAEISYEDKYNNIEETETNYYDYEFDIDNIAFLNELETKNSLESPYEVMNTTDHPMDTYFVFNNSMKEIKTIENSLENPYEIMNMTDHSMDTYFVFNNSMKEVMTIETSIENPYEVMNTTEDPIDIDFLFESVNISTKKVMTSEDWNFCANKRNTKLYCLKRNVFHDLLRIHDDAYLFSCKVYI
ncbi:hypothetical protein HNY73_015078 [Argiope bruennichi]|uniref:Uncharacterized protein n=1 Tax=Argiope bruennichi TaxID=94029 RepID=A0A8T0ERI3_ARGBR|nr:hypothetical protein HNY73_015078 [Argiope bruennichi]